MTSVAPERRSGALPILLTVMVGALAFTSYQAWSNGRALREQGEALAATRDTLDQVFGEVTRMRIEQKADGKGAAALLEMLRHYAPMMADSRVTEPDYQNAKKEVVAILRAFESLGKEKAWTPVMERLAEVDAIKDYDEIKWLLEVTVRLDLPAGKQLVKEVLMGHKLPNPRLRWFAAIIMNERDQQLAQQLLRQILLTESSRGVNVDRAHQYGMVIPDKAAYATNGFHNFLTYYVRTEDPQLEETLMLLLSRVEHDVVTIQECVKELGRRRYEPAVKQLEKLYDNPPLGQENPLFYGCVIDAIANTRGKEALPWLESKLPTAATDVVARRIQSAIDKVKQGQPVGPQLPEPR